MRMTVSLPWGDDDEKSWRQKSFAILESLDLNALEALKTRMRKKADLPTKTCATCGRPFAWRKKWARVWDEVKYCSDRCRGAKTSVAVKSGGEGAA